MDISNRDIGNAVSQKEIYRYLGYGINKPDSSVGMLVDEVLSELLAVMKPKNIYQLYDCKTEDENVFVGNMKFTSRNLVGNLAQCAAAALLAATLGLEADKLLQRYEVVNMAKASIVQACAAACIEAYCNLLQEAIRLAAQEQSGQPLFIRPRFSPGYGDLPLEAQKDIFRALDCTKRIGLTLTQNLLMYPTKSVTAFIGLTANPQNCHIEKCKICTKTDCAFRV
ncbi:MAG: Vitamin B12 dependent methionine synthase activation subunit [Lachnospiraceae bacterium]|nr:Vitamin B12 dependent methionine synthase activation subunit [Lachnospiraceae bacterium]